MSTTTATIILLGLSLMLIILPILSIQLPRCSSITTNTDNTPVAQRIRRTCQKQRPHTDGTNSRETSEDNATPYQNVSEEQGQKQEGIAKRKTATMGKKPWDPPFPKRVGTTAMQKTKTADVVNPESQPNTDQDVGLDARNEKDAEQDQSERTRQSSLPDASATINGPARRASYLILPRTTAAVPSMPVSRKSTEVSGGAGGGSMVPGIQVVRTATATGNRVERGRTMSRRGIEQVDRDVATSTEPATGNDAEPDDDDDDDNEEEEEQPSPSSTTTTTTPQPDCPPPPPPPPPKNNNPLPLSYLSLCLASLATILFLFAFAILIAHILAWFLVYKTEARLGEARRGVLRGGDMRLCLCS